MSRSATIVIAYMMWRTGQSFEECRVGLKEIRDTVSPHASLICQLLEWFTAWRRGPAAPPRFMRIMPWLILNSNVPRICSSVMFHLNNPDKSRHLRQYTHQVLHTDDDQPVVTKLDQRVSFYCIDFTARRVCVWVGARAPIDPVKRAVHAGVTAAIVEQKRGVHPLTAVAHALAHEAIANNIVLMASEGTVDTEFVKKIADVKVTVDDVVGMRTIVDDVPDIEKWSNIRWSVDVLHVCGSRGDIGFQGRTD